MRVSAEVPVNDGALVRQHLRRVLEVLVAGGLGVLPLARGLAVELSRPGHREQTIDVNVTQISPAPRAIRVLHPGR